MGDEPEGLCGGGGDCPKTPNPRPMQSAPKLPEKLFKFFIIIFWITLDIRASLYTSRLISWDPEVNNRVSLQ